MGNVEPVLQPVLSALATGMPALGVRDRLIGALVPESLARRCSSSCTNGADAVVMLPSTGDRGTSMSGNSDSPHGSMNLTSPLTLPPDDAKHLVRLVRAGRLYDVEAWVAAGKSVTLPPEFKTTLLTAALKTGFHSLIEFLLRHEHSQERKNDFLAQAVQGRRSDLVELRGVGRSRHEFRAIR